MPATPHELLAKIRKGATAAFSANDYHVALLSLPGWKTDTTFGSGKDNLTISTFTVTSPGGTTFTVSRQPNYTRLVFYSGVTINGKPAEHGYLSAILMAKTTLPADIDKAIGPVVKKVKTGREDARTCPVCMRNIKTKIAGIPGTAEMVHHGYQRPGYGYIVGDCFAVHYQPWEVSPKGMVDYVAAVLVPYRGEYAKRLANLKDGKVTSFFVTEPVYNAPRWADGTRPTKTTEVTADTDRYKFEQMTKNAIWPAESNLKQVNKDIEERSKLIAEWKPA